MKKVLIIIVGILILFFAFLGWYKWKYSMDYLETSEMGNIEQEDHILIASQGSEFKNAILDNIAEHFSTQAYLKVMDISHIHDYNPEDWEVLVLIHTWENWKPEKNAASFYEDQNRADNILVVSTSGSGELLLDELDGISAASRTEEIDNVSERIIEKIEDVLK